MSSLPLEYMSYEYGSTLVHPENIFSKAFLVFHLWYSKDACFLISKILDPY